MIETGNSRPKIKQTFKGKPIKKINCLYRIIIKFAGGCLYCGNQKSVYYHTPKSVRPRWRIYCKACGRRRSDLDGFNDY